MERQNSRRRRTPRAQPQSTKTFAEPKRERHLWWNGLWTVILLLGLVYTLDLPFGAWIRPLSIHRGPDEATVETRPNIGLHPDDHVFRQPTTQHLDWRVTSGHRRPDGVLKNVYLINGIFRPRLPIVGRHDLV